jgi:hypothetical protein
MTSVIDPAGVRPDEEAFNALVLAEYQHLGESFLRNEEDGEKRATFLFTLAGGAGAVLAFLIGDDVRIQPWTIDPLVISSLAIIAAVGYLTFVRVIRRNVATDRYKRGLNRIRRSFLSSKDDRRVDYFEFNPFNDPKRRAASLIGRGGWLETVMHVECLVLGALAAMIVPTNEWWQDGLVALAVVCGACALLLSDAGRRYRAEEKAQER